MKIISPRLRRIRRIDMAKVHNFLIQNISAIIFFFATNYIPARIAKAKVEITSRGKAGSRALPVRFHTIFM